MTQRGSGNDITSLVHEHHGPVYRYAFRLTGSTQDAEDLTQQVFLLAVQKIDQLREADRVRAWLFTVLRRCFLKSIRRQRPLSSSAADVQMEQFAADPPVDPIDRTALQDALNELPEQFRLVVLMFYFEHCSYREIAEELQLPVGTVMSRLSRAKSSLRKRLLVEPQAVAQSPRTDGS